MATLYDITLTIVDGKDPIDTFEEGGVRDDEKLGVMEALLEQATEEYNLSDFGFQFTFE